MPKHGRPDQIGEYWISPHPRTGVLCRTWYDQRSRQTRRASLSTRDPEEARLAFAEWTQKHRALRNEPPGTVTLEAVLSRYYDEHGRHRPAQPTIRRSLELWSNFFAGKTVAEVTPSELDRFIASLRGAGYAEGYVSTVLASGRAALNRARKRGELMAVPFIQDVQTAADKLDKEPKGRPLSIEEMADLMEHATTPWLRLFVVVAGNTLARPQAALDLGPFQYERDAQILKLNPTGRKQNKKRRPTIPVTRTLAAWLANTAGDRFITRPGIIHRNTLRRAWVATCRAAKLAPGAAPYSIRHTLGREMRRRGVPRDQISGFLGHQRASTTDIYAPYEPRFLAEAAAAIDAYWDDVFAVLAKRGIRFALHGRVTGGVKLLQGN